METQHTHHPPALHLAALALGKLKPEQAGKIQSHLDECEECRRYIADTPRNELAEVVRKAKNRPAAEQNTHATGLSGTVVGHPPSSPDAPPEATAAFVPSSSPAPPTPASMAHELNETQMPHDLFTQTKYRIVRLLGRGGMGSVYEAEHMRMKRRVAIKTINPEIMEHPEALLRFEEEVKTIAALDHANIGRAFDAESFGSVHAMVMEYVDGQTLQKFLEVRGRLTVTEACRCVRQAFNGLQYAHQKGLVHRDLKPQNLMLTRDTGIVKILDFGLAKVVSENRKSRGLTSAHATMGTYAYMAPEQALDAANADIRADIYSLGCTLYYLLAGQLPFEYDSAAKLLLAHQTETPLPLHVVRPDVPDALSKLVDRMLAKNPADRPQTPREAADALLPFAQGGKPAAMPSGTPSMRRLPERSNRALLWGCVAAALLLLIGVAGWLSGIFVHTPHGTIIVDNVPENAEVSVDGDVVTVNRSGDSVAIAAVEQGPHHLKLLQAGKEIWADDVSIDLGGQLVRLKFVPKLPPALAEKSPPAVAPATDPAGPGPRPAGQSPSAGHKTNVKIIRDVKFSGDGFTELSTDSWGAVVFGDPTWSHYDVTFRLMIVRGPYFILRTCYRDEGNNRGFCIGSKEHGWSALEGTFDGKRIESIFRTRKEVLENDKWYDIKLQVRGGESRAFVNGEEWLSNREDRLASGQISMLLLNKPTVRIQDFLVTSADGKAVLWRGVPMAASESTQANAAGNQSAVNATAPSNRPNQPQEEAGTSTPSSAYTVAGVSFPAGVASFADEYSSFKPGAGTGPPHNVPHDALGPPSATQNSWVSIGLGGELIVKFVDNALAASGDSKPDLCIFEGGRQQETFKVAISANTADWIDLGQFQSGPANDASVSIDIDGNAAVRPGTQYRYVKINDTSTEYFSGGAGGADIGGIGAISSVPVVPVDDKEPPHESTAAITASENKPEEPTAAQTAASEPTTNDPAPTSESDEGFEPLFNGENLTGWVGDRDAYEVVDGAIRNKPGASGNLLTRESFRNFVVRLEYRLTPGGNSGLALRMPVNAENVSQDGIEVQILDDADTRYNWKKPFQANGSVYGLMPAKPGVGRPPGQWNEMEVTLDGDKIIVKLNDAEIVNGDLQVAREKPLDGLPHPGAANSIGRFGLCGLNVPVDFRNIRIKRLSSSATSSRTSERRRRTRRDDNDGFIPLFNGKDLEGWAPLANQPGNWFVENGSLVGRGPQGYLHTLKDDFQNFHLRVRARVRENGGGGLMFRYPDQLRCEAQISVDPNFGTGSFIAPQILYKADRSLIPPSGEWFTEELIVDGGSVAVLVNGRQTAAYVNPAGQYPAGSIVLQMDQGGALEFSAIEVKVLPADAKIGEVLQQVGSSPPLTEPAKTVANEKPSRDQPASDDDSNEGFVKLFNGRNLRGWRTHPNQPGGWSVVNGILTGRGGLSHLYARADNYENVHLRVKARVNSGGNGGIYVRCTYGPTRDGKFPLGYEAQIDANAGDPNRTGSLFGGTLLVPVTASPAPAGQWFIEEIIVDGDRVIVRVNGTQTAEYTDIERRFPRGTIALQVHDERSVVEFESIEVKQLPSTKSTK